MSWVSLPAATKIALAALAVSAANFVATAPLVTQLYVRPKLSANINSSTPDADVLMGIIDITNGGNAPATKIEMGLTLQADQRITVVPNMSGRVVEEDSRGAGIKNARVEIERLSPGENIMVFVVPGPNLEKLHPDIAKTMIMTGHTTFPLITFLRSAEGSATLPPAKVRVTSQPIGK